MNLSDIKLEAGGHSSREMGMCVMEAAAFVAGREHTDHPPCVAAPIAAFLRNYNDRIPDEPRQDLVQFLEPVLDTAGDGQDERRRWLAADHAVRVFTPVWLEAAGLDEQATALRRVKPLTDRKSTLAARAAAAAAADAAAASYAARAAAYAAAYADAADAAAAYAYAARAAAASYAARAAAYAAAYAAADAAAAAAAAAAASYAARAAAYAADADAAARRETLIKRVHPLVLEFLPTLINPGASGEPESRVAEGRERGRGRRHRGAK